MNLISPTYRKQNEGLHERKGYGSSGHLWLGHVLEIAEAIGAETILDYGAGKGTLGHYVDRFGLKYQAYDPVTFPKKPEGVFDLVVCLDVLEHIEPDCLDAVLDHMLSLTGMAVFCVVNTRASSKVLEDGRNAHLIQHDWYWWKNHLLKRSRWQCERIRQQSETFDFIGSPRVRGGLSKPQKHRLMGH